MSDPDDKPMPDDDLDATEDDLVAYLDGELDPTTADAIEARLNLDPKARGEAESLKRAWDLLDLLPRTEPSTNFASRTLERLEPSSPIATAATVAISESSAPKSPRRKFLIAAMWAVALVGASVAGYFARPALHGVLFPDDARVHDAQIFADQVLLENLRLYRHVDDVEFLKELDKPDLFGDDAGGQ
jgi:anti-sigma factor RsiW